MESANKQEIGGLFSKPNATVQSVVRIKNLMNVEFEEVAKNMDELLQINVTLVEDNKSVLQRLSDLQLQYNNLLASYNKTLDAVEASAKTTSESVASVMVGDVLLGGGIAKPSGIMFDPAIHQYKPARPITLSDRNLIMSAYQNLYRQEGGMKTLPEFFRYVNDAINPTVSKTEIEGVIYNKFDERLYL